MECLVHTQSLLFVGTALVLYLSAVAVYRLYLSPIARYPGPRLAALTFWYEFYYDVVCKGRYTWKIQDLHATYGPIVRISPEELHVADPSFYDSIYIGPSRRTDKWNYSARMFGTSLATVGTTNHELHRLRRSALNAFFSKRTVLQLETPIQRVIDHACLLVTEKGTEGQVLNVRNFFAAFAADVIGQIAMGKTYGLLDMPDFEPGWQRLMMDLSRATHLMKQFPWAYTLLQWVPPWLLSLIHPVAKRLFNIRSDIQLKIQQTKASLEQDRSTRSNINKNPDQSDHPVFIHMLLESSILPPAELSTPRLEDEAFTLLGAGTVTTAHTLSAITYYILANQAIKTRLECELSETFSSMPPDYARPSLRDLEQCTYLSAIISEGLRLSFGVSHRLPRISPDIVLHYRGTSNGKDYDYIIPRNVPVSMTQMLIHLDPDIYPSPHKFDPERWLISSYESETEKQELQRRKHYLVPFSKGTRMCAGMHFARAELYLMLGTLFGPGGVGRRMELFETDVEDVECVHDFFNPSPGLNSKGVRVVLRG